MPDDSSDSQERWDALRAALSFILASLALGAVWLLAWWVLDVLGT